MQDVLQRHAQLAAWTTNIVQLPVSVWLPGLFNPKAFLTALMQVCHLLHHCHTPIASPSHYCHRPMPGTRNARWMP